MMKPDDVRIILQRIAVLLIKLGVARIALQLWTPRKFERHGCACTETCGYN